MADYKFLQHIDGAWRQLKRWVMYKYSGTPSDAQEGSFWYDTATKTPKYHNGTIAKDIGKYVVAGTGTTVSASGNDLAVSVTYGTVANTSCVGNDSRLSDARTPISHAVSATTYGVGTSSNYGHVKLYTSIGNNTDGAPTNSAVSGALALKANVSQLTDGSVTKVGTASVGSTTVPVYVNAGTLTACSGTLGVNITGNANTATKLATARAIALTGDVTGSASFDGSANASIAVTSAQLASNTGTYAPWQTKGSKGNYTGISAPGALRVNFMSRTDANSAGLYCETDSKWMVLRNADGTLKTDYAPATTSNTTEIATTAFVNSKLNQYEFDFTGGYSATNVDFAMKIASWVPSASISYSIMFEFDYAGISIYPWQNLPFSVIVTYRDGTFNVYYEMFGNHAGYSRIYCGMNSTTAEIWVLGYGSYIRFKGRMISQSHSMYSVSGSVTSTIPAYLSNMGNVVRNATSADNLGTTTVGSIYKPVYFNNGVPVLTEADVPSKSFTVSTSSISWSSSVMCYYTSGSSPITVDLDNAPRGCVLTLLTTGASSDITLNRTSSTFYVSGWSATPTSVTLASKGSVQFIIAPDYARVYVLKYQG